jgi:hypothetical protein
MTSQNDNLITATPLGRSRRGTRRVLAIRAMVGATSWLDGRLRWHNGRVAWESSGPPLVPGPGDLALAQRYHNKIRRYPISADLALGDGRAWLERRRARLELAKRLRALYAPDLIALTARARAGDQEAVVQLVALLDAEALCLDRLPASPAAALAACGTRAAAPLRALLEDEAAPLATRALAALTLGAIQMQNAEFCILHFAFCILHSQFPWLERAYRWGRRSGMPDDPALLLALLADRAGLALARRYIQATSSHSSFRLPRDLLRQLLGQDTPAAQVVALAEATAEAGALARRIVERRPAPPERPARKRKPVVECSPAERRQLVAALSELLAAYVRAAPEPETVDLFVRLVEAMLGLGRLTPELAKMIVLLLRGSLEDLPAPAQRPYLELLVEQHARLWDRSSLPPNTAQLASWLTSCWSSQVKPLLQLLATTGDAAIVREAIELDIHAQLSQHVLADSDLYRWLLALVRAFDPWPNDHDISQELRKYYAAARQQLLVNLCGLLRHYPSARAARAALQPLTDGMMAVPASMRANLLESLLDEVRRLELAPREALPRLARYLPTAAGFVKQSQNGHVCWWNLLGLLALDRTLPEQAPAWLDWSLTHLLKLEAKSADGTINGGAISVAALFAATLADGDLARFQAIFRAGMQHRFEQAQELLEQSIPVLARFPALRAALTPLFPQQPHRCAELTVRVGLAARLGRDALTPLAELESPLSAAFLIVDPRDADRGWQTLLDLAPEMAATAATYLYAQWLLGGSFDLPAGARRAVEQPSKLERELAYLERSLADRPDRADLAARAANLRAYLSERDRLLDAARGEACERMAQAAAQALFNAAEQQMLACYRRRLAGIAGPLPAGLRIDGDLLNAALLTLDVRHNRRLLRRLLRAHLAGETRWRERHPANAAFLRELAAQGCDTDAWLSTMPRVYRCASVAGGRLRLRLECDPLCVLQMGNVMDTCLSFGGINSFSTVANACELNKRVIYATDGAGRVVGRKLIGINAEGKLVGFYTYSSLADEPARAALRAIFVRYAAAFAARCGLELADQGVVATLFAEAWYDDGVVPWGDDREQEGAK